MFSPHRTLTWPSWFYHYPLVSLFRNESVRLPALLFDRRVYSLRHLERALISRHPIGPFLSPRNTSPSPLPLLLKRGERSSAIDLIFVRRGEWLIEFFLYSRHLRSLFEHFFLAQTLCTMSETNTEGRRMGNTWYKSTCFTLFLPSFCWP